MGDAALDNAVLRTDGTTRRVVRAEVDRLRRIEEAAKKLADHLPPQGAATPHTPLVLGEYGATLLYTLRAALAGVGDA